MSYVIKENDKKSATFEITVSAEEFETGLQQSYIKNKGKFSIPGFRKGKVTRKMVEKSYGEGVLYEDAVNALIPNHYDEAVTDSKLDIISQPEIDITSISKEEGFVFTAKVFLKPEVEIKDYKGIKVDKIEYNVDDNDIEKEIEALKEKTSRLVEVEREIKNDDIANINFEGFCDDVAFPGGKGENFDLTIGSGQFIPGFEEQLVGKKAGEETDVNVTFPEEYQAEDLKGKAAVFKVKINAVSEKQYPELNDDFAKDVSEFNTFDELKDDIKNKLTKMAEDRTKQEYENNLLDEMVKLAKVDVPDCMVEERIDGLVKDFDYRLQSQGLNLEKYMEYTGLEEASFREQFKERAEAQVKTSLALEEIATQEKIEATEEDVNKEYEKLAEAYKMEVDKIKQFINPSDVTAEIVLSKTVDFLVENSAPSVVKEDKEKKPTAKKTTTAKKPAAKKATTKKDDAVEDEKKAAPKKRATKKKEETVTE